MTHQEANGTKFSITGLVNGRRLFINYRQQVHKLACTHTEDTLII